MSKQAFEDLLTQVSSAALQQQLRDAIEERIAVVCREVTVLQTAQAELNDRLLDMSARYDKAVCELRFYRANFERSGNRHRRYSDDDERESIVDPQLHAGNPLMSSLSPASDDENEYYYSSRSFSSLRTSYCSSNAATSVQSQFETCLEQQQEEEEDPVDLEAMLAITEDEQNVIGHNDCSSSSSSRKPYLLIDAIMAPPPVHPPPPLPPASALKPAQEEKSRYQLSPEAAARRTDGLIYACNEGFWNTIARGKSQKDEVDRLVSAYFRRGGQPNVAKNSPSLKSVKEGYGLLHAVLAVKNSKAVSSVLEAGANPNAVALGPKREDCTAPLVLAAHMGYLRGVRLLVERGNADLFQRGPEQITALHAAVIYDSMETVLYLLQVSRSALLDSVDTDGATPLHYACGYGRTRMVTFFLKDCHAKSDIQNHKGETPLHYAVKRRQYKTVCRLVGSLGAYPNPYVPKQTPTPLDLARSCGFKAIADYLRGMGAKTSKEMEKTAATRRSSWQSRDHTSSANSSTISGATMSMTSSTICGASIASSGSGETSSVVSSSGSSITSFLGRSSSKGSRRSFRSFI